MENLKMRKLVKATGLTCISRFGNTERCNATRSPSAREITEIRGCIWMDGTRDRTDRTSGAGYAWDKWA